MFRLGIPGTVLNLLVLLAVVLVLMNLERTYRAAVGTMLWRIKFMILGLGVIFAVQLYVSSQVLLFHNTLTSPFKTVTATAILLGGVLILRRFSAPDTSTQMFIRPSPHSMVRSLFYWPALIC